ncbi:hypothetical protein D9M69_650370 [compost metagenome]
MIRQMPEYQTPQAHSFITQLMADASVFGGGFVSFIKKEVENGQEVVKIGFVDAKSGSTPAAGKILYSFAAP